MAHDDRPAGSGAEAGPGTAPRVRGEERLPLPLRWWRELLAGLSLVGRSLWRGVVDFYYSDNLTHAASIAYFALLSIFPMFLLFYSLVGSLTASEAHRASVTSFLLSYFPAQFEFLVRQLDTLGHIHFELGLGSAVALVWASLGFFSAITSAVNHAWGVEKPRSYLGSKLFALLMMIAAGLVLVATLGVSSAVQIAHARSFLAVTSEWPTLSMITGIPLRWVATVLLIVMVGLIFYFVPNTKVRFRDVWIGAVLTGAMWRVVLAGFAYYISDMSRFNLIHGSVAAVVVFLVWVYTSAVVLLYGVEFTAAYHHLRRERRQGAAPPAPS